MEADQDETMRIEVDCQDPFLKMTSSSYCLSFGGTKKKERKKKELKTEGKCFGASLVNLHVLHLSASMKGP